VLQERSIRFLLHRPHCLACVVEVRFGLFAEGLRTDVLVRKANSKDWVLDTGDAPFDVFDFFAAQG